MKKTLALLLALISLFVLCACNTKKDKTDDGDKENNGNGVSSTTSASGQPGTVNGVTVDILSIDEFYGNLARFDSEDGYGYMDKKGNIVINPAYEDAPYYFDGDLAKVRKDGKYMFIDRTGKVLFKVDFEYVEIGDYVNGAFWIETKEETIDGAVHTMTYYKYDGTSVQKAFSIQAEHADDDGSNFYVPDATKPAEKYALVHIPEEDGYSSDGVFIDFSGNKVTFTGMSEGDSIDSWYKEWAFLSDDINDNYGKYVYIDFANKTIAKSDYTYDDENDIGYGQYWIYAGHWDYDYSYYDIGILKDTYLEYGSVNGKIINVSTIEAFSKANVLDVKCGYGNYYTVYLSNSSGVNFSSVIDADGNVIIAPTKDISLGKKVEYNDYELYTFSENGLCKAKDEKTGLYGYIDKNGNWVIQPTYRSVSDFSGGADGVAIVDNKAIINSKGEVVFSLKSWSNEIVSSLSGKYEYKSYYTYYMTFNEDGTFEFKETSSYSSSTSKGKYTIKGSEIIISDYKYFGTLYSEGTYDFSKNGNVITIGDYTWILSE